MKRIAAIGFIVLAVAIAPVSRAQFTGNNQTNIISGVTSNWNGTYYVGYDKTYDQLQIVNGAALYGFDSYIGYKGSNPSSNNSVLVTGSGSVWSNWSDLHIGSLGSSGNSLVISNGGRVINFIASVGDNGLNNNNNGVLVSGTGTLWTCGSFLRVGLGGIGNSLVISNGATVVSGKATVGMGASNNTVLVTGPGSQWTVSAGIRVGGPGKASLTINDGGLVVATNMDVGPAASPGVLVVVTNSGILSIQGLANDGYLNIFTGTFKLSGGTVTVGTLATSNGAASSIAFHGGILSTKSSSISNGAAFVVGNGIHTATFQLLGGAYLFVDGLQVSTNALLTGCGTITGTVVNYGTITNDCYGGTLAVSGTVTNFGSITVPNGGLVQFNGPVVNLGTIDSSGGLLRVPGGMTNAGTLILNPNDDTDIDGIPNGYEQGHGLDPLNAADASADNDGDGFTNLQEFQAGTSPTNSSSVFRVLSLESTNGDVLVTWQTAGGRTNVVVAASDMAGSFTNVSPNIILPGSGDVTTNWLDAGGATNGASRYYKIRLVP